MDGVAATIIGWVIAAVAVAIVIVLAKDIYQAIKGNASPVKIVLKALGLIVCIGMLYIISNYDDMKDNHAIADGITNVVDKAGGQVVDSFDE